MQSLKRAIEAAGGVSALAALLGVSGSAPHMWMTREKVPAEYCPAIEGETRRIAAERADASLVVTCEELRPDVAWSVLREQAAPPPVYVATEPGAERRQRVDLPVKLDLAGDLVAAPPPEGLACDGSPGVFEDSRGVRRAA